MNRLGLAVVILGLAVTIFPFEECQAEPQKDPLVDQVRKAIEDGIAFLRDQEAGRGRWDDFRYPGDATALSLLALLNAGVPPSDPMIQRGLKTLRSIPQSRTYVVALQTMVYAKAAQPEDKQRIQSNVDWLIKGRSDRGWSYGVLLGGGVSVADNSNSQYALLGLHDGLEAGATVDPKVLESLRNFYLKTQIGGGWGYHPGEPATMTMTAAGVCSLMITGMDLAVGKQKLRPDGVADQCGIYEENEPVAEGLRWIGNRFPAQLTDANFNRFGNGAPFYCLYGIERTGRLTGQRFLGGQDWYRVGSEYLVKIQRESRWQGLGLNSGNDDAPVIATCFSLLFLAKGRTPVLVSKLAHGEGDGWNNKRSDIRHLVEYASKNLFKDQPMAWQVFDVRNKPAEDPESIRQLTAELLPSPLLFLNGHSLRISDREKAILRDYLNNGGFLLAEACCGRPRFDGDFKELMRELYPDSPLRPVPPDHPVWYASGKYVVKPDDFPLLGIQQGCKWVALYSPRPISGYWEGRDSKSGRGEVAFQLGANIIAYATGLEAPRPRLSEVAMLPAETREPAARRGFLEVGQLAFAGDWRSAPQAMRYLMQDLRKNGIDVLLNTAQVPLGENVSLESSPSNPVRQINRVNFFYLHGRNDFNPGIKAIKDLRFRLENGGTLLADACCGDPAFRSAFRKMIRTIWPDGKIKLEPIPLNDELFSQTPNGVKIERVLCRREDSSGANAGGDYQSVPPALEGVKIKGRWVVIFSPYDIGCALEKHQSSNCLGHDHASAMQLARAAVLYALRR